MIGSKGTIPKDGRGLLTIEKKSLTELLNELLLSYAQSLIILFII